MKNLLNYTISVLLLLLFVCCIFSVNVSSMGDLIEENAPEVNIENTSDVPLSNSPRLTTDESSEIQTPNKVPPSDDSSHNKYKDGLYTLDRDEEILLDDGAVIKPLIQVYSQLGIRINNQEKNDLVKVFDDSILVTVGFTRLHMFKYEVYEDHLRMSNSDVYRVIDSLNAIVVKVPLSSLKGFMHHWSSIPGVRYVEPSKVTSVMAVPNDPDWSLQYGPQIIQADLAWDIQMGDPASILVAVIDTGTDYNHPDLVNQYVPLGYDWVNNDSDPMDDHSHGTHCAGIITATINNSIGIAGVSNVSVMSEKVFDSGGWGYDYDAANAMIHATDMGATVLSNSYGFPSSSTALEDGVAYAYANDVIIVVSAGNDAAPVASYPALYPETIVVSATDSTDTPASFTSYGSAVDVAAPGVDIWSTIPVSMGSYGYMSGTSMSCPHVAAVCALIRAEFPLMSNEQVRQHLRNSADDLGPLGWDDYYGYGRLNAYKAVQPPPEHELVAYLDAPNALLPGTTTDLIARVANWGQHIETDVDLQLWIDDVLVASQSYPSLPVSASEEFNYTWTPTIEGTYNVTAYVVPVANETFLDNNQATNLVLVTQSIIDYELGGFIQMNDAQYNGTWANFMYEYEIDSTHVYTSFGDGYSWFSVNTLTRLIEDGNLWVGMYYMGQIETNIDVGDTINWHSTTGTVIGTVWYDWYGMSLEAWEIEIAWGDTYAYYHKSTGVWLYYLEWSGFELYMENTNMIEWQLPEHELVASVDAPDYVEVGQATMIEVDVYNGGANTETDVELLFYIDGVMMSCAIYPTLLPGDTGTLLYLWTPITPGIYNITAYAVPVTNEMILGNNVATKLVLATYLTLVADFEGPLVGGSWDGLWHLVDDSQPYGESHSPTHSMYYGQDDTGNYDTGDRNYGTLMTPWYVLGSDAAAMTFWSWYETEESGHTWDTKDVYLVTLNGSWIPLGYVSGDMDVWVPFTFDISAYQGQIVRFAFMFDTFDSIANYFRGWYVDDVVIIGTAEKFLFHDVGAGLEVPDYVLPDIPTTIYATVSNLGTYNETDVLLQLWINDTMVDCEIYSFLGAGETEVLSYSWLPVVPGTYEIMVYVLPVMDDLFFENNEVSKDVIAAYPMLNFELGDYIYFVFDDGYSFHFTYEYFIDPVHVYMTTIIDDAYHWLSVNIITGFVEDGSTWVGTYYLGQIGTDYTVGDTVNHFSTTGTIVGTAYFDWDGMTLEAWDIYIASWDVNVYYHKGTGIWLHYFDNIYAYAGNMVDTNMITWVPPEHDLVASLLVSPMIPLNEPTMLEATVYNRGLNDEADVELQIRINGVLVSSATYPMLPMGTTGTLSYLWIPTTPGIYNITAYAVPALNETYIVNNIVTQMVEVQAPGDVAILQDVYPWGMNWTYILDMYGITYNMFDSSSFGTIDLSIYQKVIIPSDQTQEFYNAINMHLGWLESYVANGGTLEIHAADYGWNGGGWAGPLPGGFDYYSAYEDIVDIVDPTHQMLHDPYEITDEELDYWGSSIHGYLGNIGSAHTILATWSEPVLIEAEYGSGYILVSTQTLEWAHAYGYSYILENILLYNPVPQEHDLVAYLYAPDVIAPDTTVTLTAIVTNAGMYNETDVELQLWIDGLLVASDIYSLLPMGTSEFLNYSWTPTLVDTYSITAYAVPLFNESNVLNNEYTKTVIVTDMQNYEMIAGAPYSWYDAYANGYSLNLIGDDVSAPVDLPFMFYYYDTYFSTVYVSSNGWLSFYDSDPWEYWPPGFPTPDFPYAVAPFWIDLQADNNVYIWSTPDFVVIEYHDYYYLGGSPLAGTFEVVFFANGEILFQYQNIDTDWGATVGLNYGLITDFYNVYTAGLGGVTDFALLFTLGPQEGHDLGVLLDAPTSVMVNSSVTLDAYVFNQGTYNETDVELQLWIAGILVASEVYPFMEIGATEMLSYLWTPMVTGTYNISAYVVPVYNETSTLNNMHTVMTEVSEIILDFELGDYLMIEFPINETEMGWLLFTYETYIDPIHVNVTAEWFDGYTGWMSVNILTRLVEDGTLWVGTYYIVQIETNIDVGDPVNWLDDTGYVNGTDWYDWNGTMLEAWVISLDYYNPGSYALYHKETGIWLYLWDSAAEMALDLLDTNMIDIPSSVTDESDSTFSFINPDPPTAEGGSINDKNVTTVFGIEAILFLLAILATSGVLFSLTRRF
ncbi:MAG: S8 family serine peptidase [Promethearchaeota archaeon]